MIIDANIDYTNAEEVIKILGEIKKGIKENDVTIYKMCDRININKSTYSQFIAGKKYYVSEDRIRKIVEYINLRHQA